MADNESIGRCDGAHHPSTSELLNTLQGNSDVWRNYVETAWLS